MTDPVPTEGQRLLELPHLEFAREPDWEPPRRRRRGFGLPRPLPTDRGAHAQRLGDQLGTAVRSNMAMVAQLPVDASRIQVLEFRFWEPAIPEILSNRYGARLLKRRVRGGDAAAESYSCVLQFATPESIQLLQSELQLYGNGDGRRGLQPPAERRKLFDNLVDVRSLTAEDRTGYRLGALGVPTDQAFFLDIDLWHPGETAAAIQSLGDLRRVCAEFGTRVTDEVRTSGLLLARASATQQLLPVLLNLPSIQVVDLPTPVTSPYADLLLAGAVDLPVLPNPLPSDPLVGLVDSGVVAGHPLLTNWIADEAAFGLEIDSMADDHGHGTAVASLLVHGSIAEALRRNEWTPRVQVCSAKILYKDPVSGRAIAPPERRLESLLEEAVRELHLVSGCRVFCIPVEQDLPEVALRNRHQYPTAQCLDELARELDVVIVVIAGNALPPIPEAAIGRVEALSEVRDLMLRSNDGVCVPGTALNAVTVGSIARVDSLGTPGGNGIRDAVVGASAGSPSPFSRTGAGTRDSAITRAVKPDFVQYGGNAAIQTTAGGQPRWTTSHALLGEPVAKLGFDGGRFLTGVSGTSFAAPHVAHLAAITLKALEDSLGRPPTANLVRATLAVSATEPPCADAWFASEDERLRLTGYGYVDDTDSPWSSPNSVRLVAEDKVLEDRMAVYRLVIPDEFLANAGRRGLTVALAYDPPVRSSREEYLSRTMQLEILQGVDLQTIAAYKAKRERGAPATGVPPSQVDLRPPMQRVEWSTLQVRSKTWASSPRFRRAPDDGLVVLYVLVKGVKRFDVGDDGIQRFGLAVRLWHQNQGVNIYQPVQQAVRLPAVELQVTA